MKSFVKQVLAAMKGDNDKVIAERNYRKANSAVKGQLSSLESKKVDAEVDLDEAKDALVAAKYPITLIKDNATYIRTIVKRQEDVDSAQEKLDSINESSTFFKELSDEFNAK